MYVCILAFVPLLHTYEALHTIQELSDTFNQLTALINKLETELKQLMEEFNSRKRVSI